MSEHHATIEWQRGAADFTYKAYSRDHDWTFSGVRLRPDIAFGGEPPSPTELNRLHQQAHHGCFIANSVHTAITVEQP